MVSVDVTAAMINPVAAHEHDLLRVLFSRMPVAVAVYNADLRLQSFNPTWVDYMEGHMLCERSRIVPGMNLYVLAPNIEAQTRPLFKRALAGEIVREEGLRLDSQGVVSYLDVVLSPLYEDGHVISIVEAAIDATERVLAYQTLEQRVEERTREIERRSEVAASLGEMLALLNSQQSPREILRRLVVQARRLLGADCALVFELNADKDMLVLQFSDGAPEKLFANYILPVGLGAVGQAVLKREPVLIPDARAALPAVLAELNSEGDRQLRDKLRQLVRHYSAALAVPLIVRGEVYGGISLYYANQRDFTDEDMRLADMFAHQAALAIENARLRQQIAEVAVTAERNRIARDLHDSVTQTLFSASLIADVLPRLWERNGGEARKRLDELRQLTKGALAEMRMMLLELRPGTLANVSVSDLLRQLVEVTEGSSYIPVTLDVEGDCTLPLAVHDTLYRIAQEALNNVAKHSDATKATVHFNCSEGAAELSVTDNGKGFDPANVTGEHLGLNIMRERAQEVSAELKIESKPGGGTRVFVRWENGKIED